MAKICKIENRKGMNIFWCPGCQCVHRIATAENDSGFPIWQWNGDMEKPNSSRLLQVKIILPKYDERRKTKGS